MWKDELQQYMWARGYGERTVEAYCDNLERMVKAIHKDPSEMTENDLEIFLSKLNQSGKSPYTLNQYHMALKIIQTGVYKKQWKTRFAYAKRHKKLPMVLSNEEIAKILSKITNMKHKLLVALAYGAGLRVSEVINLRIQDLDWTQKIVTVRSGKGEKDRITLLPERIIDDLQRLTVGKISKDYVFESERGGKLNQHTAQAVFGQAMKKAQIKKEASFHSLRHSFATHLLENGVDVRYIQKLLGHASITTTQLYTKVTNPALLSIRSPL